MSRLAKKPLIVPTGVQLTIADQQAHIKGKKGDLTLQLHDEVLVENHNQEVVVRARHKRKKAHPMIGTTYRLLRNMIQGVHEGFERKLQLVGVGYRAKPQGKGLELSVGFSNPKQIDLRAGIGAELPTNTEINLKGIDKQIVGQSAADIIRVRPTEPYKGKGIRKFGAKVVLKETKKK